MTAGILVSSESDEGAFELLTKGRELSKELNMDLSVLVVGNRNIQSYYGYGAREVLLIPTSGTFDAETYTHILFEIAKDNGPDVILISSTRLGKQIAGRVAQKLQAGCVTDAIGLTFRGSALVVERYALGGNTISTEIIKTRKKVISVMPRTFEAKPAPVEGMVRTLDLKIPPRRVELIERRKKTGESVNIQSAETLVCVGKGLSKKEDLVMLNELCAALKAELGCTRSLSSDFHWISEDRMV